MASALPAPRRASGLDPVSWLALGVIGLLLFGTVAASIFFPILVRFPYPEETPFVLAIAGGALVVLGFSRFSQSREERRHRPPPLPQAQRPSSGVGELPSFEIYDPKARRP